MQVDTFSHVAYGGYGQVVLDQSFSSWDSAMYKNTQIVPVYTAGVSLVVLLVHLAYTYFFSRGIGQVVIQTRLIYAFMVLRLLGSIVLVGLFGATLFKDNILSILGCLVFIYSVILSSVALIAKPRISIITTRHYNTVLFVTFAVYFYRDLWPLMTFTEIVQDAMEGNIIWAKVAMLTLLGCVVPLAIPRPYTPLDPENPMPEPNPEQTASIFSLMSHYYLDRIVFKAYSMPHLPFELLQPLADYDETAMLKERSFKELDVFSGAPRRHIFWSIMKVFRKDYFVLLITVFLYAFATFASPLGLNRLLNYLETGGEGVVVRPWVWICGLFIGPLFASVCVQWYVFTATRLLVICEALLTQLVFETSLRVRLKASTSEVTPTLSTTASTDSDETAQDDASVTSASSTSTKVDAPSSDASNLVGKIMNLVTTDLDNILNGRDFLFLLVYAPVQISLAMFFLYKVLGWSAMAGLAFLICMLPVPGFVAKFTQTIQENRLKKSDGRVQLITETLNVLRMVKLFGWEYKMDERLRDKREEELIWIRWRQILELVNSTINFVIPLVTMIITFGFHTIVLKKPLTASVVFSSMSVFDILRDQLHLIFASITEVMSGKVSIDRMNAFLHDTELLDAYTAKSDLDLTLAHRAATEGKLGFSGASFVWSGDASPSGTLTPSKRKFSLHIDGTLEFQKGVINLIVGPTGSGKTSLLMALLGEMHYLPHGPESWVGLPRDGGVAYAAQESWVQNETIMDNVLFGAPFDEARYKKVIYQCGLERDLTLFEAGDQTEVGEKGLTLSGGQKARITLARAMYSSAEIILLDDVLAALDVHTSKWIIDKCLSGDIAQGRTILLVTHNVVLAQPIAEFVVSVKDGRVVSQGTLKEALQSNEALMKEIKEEQEAVAETGEEIDEAPFKEPAKSGQLIVAEEIEEGHVSWPALNMYFQALGGSHIYMFFLTFVGGLAITQIIYTMQTWWMGFWASQYVGGEDDANVPVVFYIGVYSLLAAATAIIYAIAILIYYMGAIRACRVIHQKLIRSVLGTTLRWLDTTPTSRIIARCTQDIRAVDGPVTMWFLFVVDLSVMLFVKFLAIVCVTPFFLIPAVFVFVAGAITGQIYIKAQLSVKREMSNAKAPVLSHFGAAINGLASIRAYGVQAAFIKESIVRNNRYSRAGRIYFNLNRWICVRVDALGGIFAAVLALYLVYFLDQEASTTGFSLNMAIGFSGLILWWIRNLNEFEVQGNSLERILGYINIEQEATPTERGEPPAYWPASGSLVVENLSARYSVDGPKVLHNISFELKSGERVGVVGRTGSGKSSLTLSLLRCIFTEGNVVYDGLSTSSLNLDALRKSITIIPQMPELLSGSLRQNIDPFSQYDDAILNNALRASGLFALQEDNIIDEGEKSESHITLDSAISSGGSNLSVGQRQIIALARALVRGSKLLILDEATSAIDYKTDAIIQNSLRDELAAGDVTLITVAHRLQTIMDADKIMVLDAGRLVEFDSPKALLAIPGGKFKSLVDESNDKDILYVMAHASLNPS